MFFTQISGSCLRFYATLALSLLFVAHAMSASQTSGQSLSLHQAISHTLASNPQLYQFDIKRDSLLGLKEVSDLSPAVNIGFEIENFGGGGQFSGTESAEMTLALSSVLELGGGRLARNSVADARLQSLNYHRQTFTLDVLGEMTATFIRLLEVQELSALALEGRDIAFNTLNIVKSRSKQGAAPEYEVKRANSAFLQSQLQVDALEQQHKRLMIKLAAYWGETSPKWTRLEGNIYAFGGSSGFSDLYSRAKESPAMAQFASEVRLKEAEVSLAKTQTTSNLSWQLGVRRFQESGDNAFIAGVSIPLFSGKRNQGALRSAMAAVNEVSYERKTALLKLHVLLFDAYSQRQQYVAAVEVFRADILPDLSSALASTQQAYETGRYSYQDWVSAQKQLLDAKKSLIENAAAASINQAIIEQLIAEPLSAQEGSY